MQVVKREAVRGASFALDNEGMELLLTDMYTHQNSSEILGIETL